MPERLTKAFFDRDVVDVARELLGCRLERDDVVLRITEVEAYGGPEDTASHARFGRTDRNEPMWGPPGRAYVFMCYGVHSLLNVVTGPVGEAAAVLIRACEPVAGVETIQRRRKREVGSRIGPDLLAGPGKVGAALGLDTSWSKHPFYSSGGLVLRPGDPPSRIVTGPRVGIDYATPEDRDRPWRFADAESAWVTQRKRLR